MCVCVSGTMAFVLADICSEHLRLCTASSACSAQRHTFVRTCVETLNATAALGQVTNGRDVFYTDLHTDAVMLDEPVCALQPPKRKYMIPNSCQSLT